ncbi:hypothetical protein BaRGS_00011207 [Batillaria attramentaria]|uniref:Uncharacterized protein n=1 Tax=Batillaria attramentaria TaxID=370345 RepID=A0ABD0LDB8_9CAEN
MMGKNTVSTVIFASLLLLHMSGISARNPAAGDNGNGNGGLNHIPSFGNVEELCEWLCQNFDDYLFMKLLGRNLGDRQ